MTKREFIKLIDSAITDCTYKAYGGYTCNILSMQENKKDHNKKTKTRNEYCRIFRLAKYSIDSILFHTSIAYYYKPNYIKNVRLNCLELFKIIMLESKGYKKL